MVKDLFLFIIVSAFCSVIYAQADDTIPVGIHQEQSEYYSLKADSILSKALVQTTMPGPINYLKAGSLSHLVYGWHPYWASSAAYQNYDYSALTHISYFSFEVDTATGSYSNLRGWNTTPIIDYAHQRGVKVTLTVTNFGSARNIKILSDTVKQYTLISNIIQQLKARNGDGVNFDFETVPLSQKANMVAFCKRAVRLIKAQLPAAEISLATPAVDWSGAWDYNALADICDYLIIMGYNYYYSGSSTAGPVAPLIGESQNVTKSIDTYLNAGVPPEKLLLGVPWYGYDWPVSSADRKAASTGAGTARFYNAAEALAETYGKELDATTKVPWLSYNSSSWRQLWYDDSLSLSLKNDLVINKDIAGIGIWALSYDGGRSEIWGSIKASYGGEGPDRCMIVSISPNPVITSSRIRYYIPAAGQVTLRIIDVSGATRAVLVNHYLEAGYYDVAIASDDFSTGVYYCVLQVGKEHTSKMIAVLRRI